MNTPHPLGLTLALFLLACDGSSSKGEDTADTGADLIGGGGGGGESDADTDTDSDSDTDSDTDTDTGEGAARCPDFFPLTSRGSCGRTRRPMTTGGW